jgi:hypothetical protein
MKYSYICTGCGDEYDKVPYGGLEVDKEPDQFTERLSYKYIVCKYCCDEEEEYQRELEEVNKEDSINE